MTLWTAIVLAGRRPGGDPFADGEGVPYKGLVDVGGRTMLARVLATLAAVPAIGRIVVLAQEPAVVMAGIAPDPRIVARASAAGISASIAAIAGSTDAPWPVLVTTADHPLLTPATVAEFLAGAGDAAVAVGMVERATLLARYPASRRTWLKFRDGGFTGANLFALGGPDAARALALWAGVERDRKQAWKLFLAFGPRLALRALTRTIALDRAIARAGRNLGFAARLVRLSEAEAAIDVDKPADLTLARAIVAARGGAGDADAIG